MSKRYYIFLILLIYFFASCKKTDDYIIPLVFNKVEMTLNTDLQIQKVKFYQSDTFLYEKINTFLPNTVISVEKDNNGNIIKTSTYYLNNFALADSCVDSVFSGNAQMTILLIKYLYDSDGYISTANCHYRNMVNDSVVSTYTYDLSYNIKNGNIASVSYSNGLVCHIEYNELPNKIDILSYIGSCCGKIDKNLLITTNCSGGISEPHTSKPHHTYYYTLNSDGFVVKKIDFYTPSYDAYDENPHPIKYITQFIYNFQ